MASRWSYQLLSQVLAGLLLLLRAFFIRKSEKCLRFQKYSWSSSYFFSLISFNSSCSFTTALEYNIVYPACLLILNSGFCVNFCDLWHFEWRDVTGLLSVLILCTHFLFFPVSNKEDEKWIDMAITTLLKQILRRPESLAQCCLSDRRLLTWQLGSRCVSSDRSRWRWAELYSRWSCPGLCSGKSPGLAADNRQKFDVILLNLKSTDTMSM